jgi:hypothetical protein
LGPAICLGLHDASESEQSFAQTDNQNADPQALLFPISLRTNHLRVSRPGNFWHLNCARIPAEERLRDVCHGAF